MRPGNFTVSAVDQSSGLQALAFLGFLGLWPLTVLAVETPQQEFKLLHSSDSALELFWAVVQCVELRVPEEKEKK